MRQLCDVLASENVMISASLVYRLLKFAELFSAPREMKLIQKMIGLVSWDSMMRILHIKDENQRTDLITTAASDELSTRDVRKLIVKNSYRRPNGGNPPAGPEEHPNQALKSLHAFTAKWPVVVEAWLNERGAATQMTSSITAESVSDEFLKDLKMAIVLLKEMTEFKQLATILSAQLPEPETK